MVADTLTRILEFNLHENGSFSHSKDYFHEVANKEDWIALLGLESITADQAISYGFGEHAGLEDSEIVDSFRNSIVKFLESYTDHGNITTDKFTFELESNKNGPIYNFLLGQRLFREVGNHVVPDGVVKIMAFVDDRYDLFDQVVINLPQSVGGGSIQQETYQSEEYTRLQEITRIGILWDERGHISEADIYSGPNYERARLGICDSFDLLEDDFYMFIDGLPDYEIEFVDPHKMDNVEYREILDQAWNLDKSVFVEDTESGMIVKPDMVVFVRDYSGDDETEGLITFTYDSQLNAYEVKTSNDFLTRRCLTDWIGYVSEKSQAEIFGK